MITDEFGAMVQVLVDDPTAQIQRLKQQLQASEEREKVLREALDFEIAFWLKGIGPQIQGCWGSNMEDEFINNHVLGIRKRAALVSTAEPEVTS